MGGVKNVYNKVKTTVTKEVAFIKGKAVAAFNSVKTAVVEKVGPIVKNIKTSASSAITALSKGDFKGAVAAGKEAVSAVGQGVKEGFNTLKTVGVEAGKELISDVKGSVNRVVAE